MCAPRMCVCVHDTFSLFQRSRLHESFASINRGFHRAARQPALLCVSRRCVSFSRSSNPSTLIAVVRHFEFIAGNIFALRSPAHGPWLENKVFSSEHNVSFGRSARCLFRHILCAACASPECECIHSISSSIGKSYRVSFFLLLIGFH